ncbi:GNAT family N-acetyltransferase [Streptosporangium saharense]|uniref:GNAT superfamily N-acetyltransferase n=1 Tax=Streptosporangium saharense TaxID=1706840 RepID=A0A7W7QPZ2_9ACTN|nr:GNAT family N-acetyltransferase [Streptosporangium saharense]MBB4917538.1 GNAT superfamily N-acetyltransferase [Streptosporangium saharense]
MGLEFRRVTGEAAAQVLDERHVELYLATRAEPPYLSGPLYQPDRYLERTGRQVKRPGFTAVSAEDGPILVGFAFGVPLASWWGGHATPAPPEVTEASSLFAVIELNVCQDHRNQGIGRKLLDELLTGQEAPYATVLANPAAPAHDMYLRWGWRKVGTVQATPDAMVSDALIRKLPG